MIYSYVKTPCPIINSRNTNAENDGFHTFFFLNQCVVDFYAFRDNVVTGVCHTFYLLNQSVVRCVTSVTENALSCVYVRAYIRARVCSCILSHVSHLYKNNNIYVKRLDNFVTCRNVQVSQCGHNEKNNKIFGLYSNQAADPATGAGGTNSGRHFRSGTGKFWCCFRDFFPLKNFLRKWLISAVLLSSVLKKFNAFLFNAFEKQQKLNVFENRGTFFLGMWPVCFSGGFSTGGLPQKRRGVSVDLSEKCFLRFFGLSFWQERRDLFLHLPQGTGSGKIKSWVKGKL